MDLPRITVVTPSFNQGRYIEATIRSVLDQNYPNLEYLVLDGGSTDGSVDIIRRYADRLTYWVSEPDGGQAAAIAKGFRRATGDILAWLNSDDLYLPGALATVGQTFARDPSAQFVYGSRHVVDEDGRLIRVYHPPTLFHRFYFAFGQWIPQECAFWRRGLYDRAGGIDEAMFFALDLSLFMRMRRWSNFTRIPQELAAIRMHALTKTSLHWEVRTRETKALRAANGIPHFSSRTVNKLVERTLLAQGRVEHRGTLVARALRRYGDQPR
jgi:glycosyltransferase involved in cell wall biosynthesis